MVCCHLTLGRSGKKDRSLLKLPCCKKAAGIFLRILNKFDHTFFGDLPSGADLKALNLIGVQEVEHGVFADFKQVFTFVKGHNLGNCIVHFNFSFQNLVYYSVYRFIAACVILRKPYFFAYISFLRCKPNKNMEESYEKTKNLLGVRSGS